MDRGLGTVILWEGLKEIRIILLSWIVALVIDSLKIVVVVVVVELVY
jgi:hypothetical protein